METRNARARQASLNHLELDSGLLRIRSLERLRASAEFLLIKQNERQPHPVCIVDIELYDKRDQPVRRISSLLVRTPLIDTLRIELRNLSKFKGLCLFRGVTLPNLKYLSCGNMHHAAIAEFVERHPNLKSLSVRRCTGGSCGTCALNTLSSRPDLQEISGPSSCMHGLVSLDTKVLHVVWDPSNSSEDKDTMLFARVKVVRANISLLSTQFFPGDVAFTKRLSDAFPRLSTLRLTEAPRQTELNVRYPWTTKGGLWKEGLNDLSYLKRLHIQTTSPPIAQPGERESELTLITTLAGDDPSNLEDITLEYSCQYSSYESIWKRIRGASVWIRLGHSKTSKTV